MHIGRTSLWVLLGIAFLLLFLRCLLLRLFPDRFGLPAPNYPSTKVINLISAATLCGIVVSAYFILKPDRDFLIYLGEKALAEKDYEEAVYDYEPLAKWGTDRVDVYNNLAIGYYNLGRYREAVESFHRVQSMAPRLSVYSYIFCARAHEQLGEPAAAVAQLNQALPLAQTAEQQDTIRNQLETLRRNYPNAVQ